MAGALSLHELRYLLAPTGETGGMARHGYLSLAVPATATLVALALGGIVLRLARRGSGGRTPTAIPVWRLGLAAAGLLLALFAAQETLESTLAGGGPAGLGVLTTAGGWVAIPLSLLVGSGVALAGRAGRDALMPVRVSARLTTASAGGCDLRRPEDPLVLRAVGLARHIAGRGPPWPP
jgi:hypothetical protein